MFSKTSLKVSVGMISIISSYFFSIITSFKLDLGINTFFKPDSAAASILAVAPPIGITSPRTFNEPVKATV